MPPITSPIDMAREASKCSSKSPIANTPAKTVYTINKNPNTARPIVSTPYIKKMYPQKDRIANVD